MMYKIMKHYGLQQKVVNVIRNSYEGFKCRGREGQDVRRKNWCSPGRCMVAYSLWPCDKLCVG